MKHFAEPLSVLVNASDASAVDVSREAARPFVSALAARLQRSGSLNADIDTVTASPDDVLNAVNAARVTFRQRARRLRCAFVVVEVVRRVSKTAGAHSAGRDEGGSLQFASAVLRGRVERDVRYLGMVVK